MKKSKFLQVLFGVLVIMALAGCSSKSKVTKIKDFEKANIELYDLEKYADVKESLTINLSDYVLNISEANFSVTTESQGVECKEIVDNKLSVDVTTPGEKIVSVEVKDKTKVQFTLEFKINATSLSKYFVKNAGFETGDLSDWTIDGTNEVYSASDNLTYFSDLYEPAPTINQDGTYYLDGFNQSGKMADKDLAACEAWVGSITSSEFTLGGSGWITFKLGGSNASDLGVRLMKKADGGDQVVATFNNWMFSDPYRSFGLTTYAYKADSSLIGSQLYFKLIDNKVSGFAGFTADSFHTYYPSTKEPVVDYKNIFEAGYIENKNYQKYLINQFLDVDKATNQLPNGDFETGDMTSWLPIGLDGAYNIHTEGTFFGSFFPNNEPIYGADGKYFLGGGKFDVNTNGFNGTGSIVSKAFKVMGTRWITFKLGGGNSELLSLKLYAYSPQGEDELVASFTNHLFTDPYRSIAMSNYGYKVSEEYAGRTCYFVLEDKAGGDVAFSALSLDSVKTYYEEELTMELGAPMAITNDANSSKISDDTRIYPAGHLQNPANFVNIKDLIDIEGADYELRNGDFETGTTNGWFMSLVAKGLHEVSNQTTFFKDFPWVSPKPIYNKDKEYFFTSGITSDFPREDYIGSIYSQAFKVGGTRWITFKLAGTNSGNVEVRLMKYVDGTKDVEISKFNNYLFTDPVRMYGMTRYAYQIPEEYKDAYCYFEIVDKAPSGASAIIIDSFKTYYEAAPVLFIGNDEEAKGTNIADDQTFIAKYVA